jgi:hypothetical protein
MSLLAGKNLSLAPPIRAPSRVVVLREHRADASLGAFVNELSSLANVELHIVDAARSSERADDSISIVVRPHGIGGKRGHSKAADSQQAQSLWSKCGPGNVSERLSRYSTRIGANLAVIQEGLSPDRRRWWRPSAAERLAFRVPVLSVPATTHSVFDVWREFRWLVVLDGSPYAEAVLPPLQLMAHWLPADVTLAQPLIYAQLWRSRVAGGELATVTRLGVSIADSDDYLRRVAMQEGYACARVCSVSDRNPAAALTRIIDSEAVDGVAIGISKRSRFMRRVTGEFNELILGKLKKPYLIATAA